MVTTRRKVRMNPGHAWKWVDITHVGEVLQVVKACVTPNTLQSMLVKPQSERFDEPGWIPRVFRP
ncbi:hypothetical protein [Amycolatopsis sp. Hca4]|uniref:hypothetical protein n=1 Tax=Amycolatopsis sp. Hca4 TaxID=2742131 RepID=UPI001590A6B9|nr:hypothetical protein [Amycolatopsis sp. Hca4]QKV73905.1 hypothetical protein HUT10_09080 [Amycolatopsis sp. Hca4]